MKKAFYMMAAAAIALSSCSSEETTDVAKSSAISFRTSVGLNSRGAETTTDNLESMWVTGYNLTDNVTYFSGVQFDKEKVAPGAVAGFLPESAWYWQAGKRYKFVAISPAIDKWHGTLDIQKDNVSFKNVVIPENISDQKDLVIGSNTAKADDHMNGTASQLTLQHVLSQLQFKVHNGNKRITYHIAGLRVVHAADKGSYSFDTSSKVGKWDENATTGEQTYELKFTQPIMLNGTDGHTHAFLTPENHGAMIVPQVVTPWDGAVQKDDVTYNNGTYIALLVNVRYTNGAYIYPAKSEGEEYYGWVAVPVPTVKGSATANWEMGKKYIYTLNLSEGCGKVDPVKPNPDGGGVVTPGDKDPLPGENIFGKPIKFTVEVSTWDDGSTTDIQM